MALRVAISDLDGTALPSTKEGMPSERLIRVVERLKDRMIFTVATGRSISICRRVFETLRLEYPCVVAGGTQIMDPQTEKILWEQKLTTNQVLQIAGIAFPYSFPIHYSDNNHTAPAAQNTVKGPEHIVRFLNVPGDITRLMQKLRMVTGTVAHATSSWKPEHTDIHITHEQGTKQHALHILMDMLGTRKEEVVAFGDAANDLPLFEAAGYTVAMSTGPSQLLKDRADEIAPNEENEGVAQVLERLFQ